MTIGTLASACDSDPINQRVECSLEEFGLGLICLPDEHKQHSHEACVETCKDAQAAASPFSAIQGYECDDVTFENFTDEFPQECEIETDWDAVLFDDPGAPLDHNYSCQNTQTLLNLYCSWDVDGDGTIEGNEGSYPNLPQAFNGCGEDATDAHQECINNCTDVLQDLNNYWEDVGADCEYSIALCDSIGFPVELEASTCDAAGMKLDRGGDRAENLEWSTADGGTKQRPLACSLTRDCCDGFGALACANLAADTVIELAAKQTTNLAGTIKIVLADGSSIESSLDGMVTSSSRGCSNPAGTCPLYVERLQLGMRGELRGIVVDGVGYDITRLSTSLDAPVLGALDSRTRVAKLSGDRVALRVEATAHDSAARMSASVNELVPLPSAINAEVNRRGEVVRVTASLGLPGGTTVHVDVSQNEAGGRK